MGKLFFFGDSITAGKWDENGGWANRIISEIMKENIKSGVCALGFECIAYNLGIAGNGTLDVLKRLEDEVHARANKTDHLEKIQLVFLIGVIDSLYLPHKKTGLFSLKEFENNISQLMHVATTITKNVSFIGLLPVNETIINRGDRHFLNSRLKEFDGIIHRLCKKKKLSSLLLFDKWLDRIHLLEDGLHPNTEGHEFLANDIKPFLLSENFFSFHTHQC